ncbi:MAG: Gfo/Idh/MocA family oxidoreductase [Clostridia bacterium]|nr:Gfo/Idh/MocA family oxidoreductase [Clostridia bacterium]
MKKVNWAVMGPGRITEEFIPALLYVEGAHPYAVASRSIDRAKAAQARYGFEKAYGSYAELVADKNIDVIYIATPTACHFENAKLCLENGHNVLCEKSVTLNVDQFNELVEIAKANNVFFMEGVWMQFHPAFRKAVEWVRDGKIGNAKYIKAELAWEHPYDANDRIFAKRLGAGTLLDLGVYTFGFACSVFGFDYDRLHAVANFGPDGADIDSNVQLCYPNGSFASLMMGYCFSTTGEAIIAGDNGKIVFTERFHDAQRVYLYDENYELVEEFDGTFPCTGFEQEIEHVNDCLAKGLKESPIVSFDYTRAIFNVINDCEAQFEDARAKLGL